MEATEELVIDESNFDQYFFDVRKHKPKKGQIMAKYTAIAAFEKCNEKENIVDLLSKTDKALPAMQVMRKLLFASEEDSVKVLMAMSKDYLETKDRDFVINNPYKYKMEMFYYVDPKYIPRDDPHWSTVSILNLNEFIDEKDGLTIHTKFDLGVPNTPNESPKPTDNL